MMELDLILEVLVDENEYIILVSEEMKTIYKGYKKDLAKIDTQKYKVGWRKCYFSEDLGCWCWEMIVREE